jgi:hypothetical protein
MLCQKWRRSIALAGAFVSAAGPSAVQAEEPRAAEPPPMLGPPASDDVRPTGREVAPVRARPDAAAAPVVACSFDEPVCVHAPDAAPPEALLGALRHAERALGGFRALGLPGPLPDGPLGGGPAFDIYLIPGTARPVTTVDLLPQGGGHDRQSAFTVMAEPPLPTACEARAAVAHALAEAICLRFDAGAEAGAVSMTASYLASLVSDCELIDLAAIDDFQRTPQRALTAGAAGAADGSLLFPWFLDGAYGLGNPGSVILSLLSVATQRTPPGAWAWNNEPDLFDALRANMKERGRSVDELLLDFAIARGFVGSRSDEAHLVDVARFGDLGRVRFEWAIPFASLPRRLAPSAPIEPTGATYLWLDLTSAPPGAELTVVADWELPSLFRWALIKVDRSGMEAGRVTVAGVYGDSHVERTVVGLADLAGIMVVGVNAGSADRSRPFDPDEAPFMPHSYTVTFAK